MIISPLAAVGKKTLPFNNHPTLSNNLIAYWAFESTYAPGTVRQVVDATGQFVLPAPKISGGCPGFKTGMMGQTVAYGVLNCDAGNLVSGNGRAFCPLTFDLTVACWMSSGFTNSAIVYLQGAPNAAVWRLRLNNHGGGVVRPIAEFFSNLYDANGFTDFISAEPSSGSISDLNWHFVVAQYNYAARTCTIQVDNGTVYTSTNPTGGTSLYGLLNDGSSFGLSTGGSDTNDAVDELGLWGRLLTAAELSYLYNGGNAQTYGANIRTLNVTVVLADGITPAAGAIGVVCPTTADNRHSASFSTDGSGHATVTIGVGPVLIGVESNDATISGTLNAIVQDPGPTSVTVTLSTLGTSDFTSVFNNCPY